MTDITPAISGDTFGYEVDIHGVRLYSQRKRLCSAVLSDGEIDAVITRLHLELEGVSAEMKTALRRLKATPLFGDDDT